jgi:hypothetical protein
MSVLTTEKQTRKETESVVPTCVIMNKPTKFDLQILALKNRTTLSYLLNVAAEEYLKRYAESHKEPFMIK